MRDHTQRRGCRETVTERRSRLVLPAALPFRRAAGLFFVALLIVAFTLLGHPAVLDPAILIPVVALAASPPAAGQRSSRVLAGAAYLFLYYAQTGVEASGGLARVSRASWPAPSPCGWPPTSWIAAARASRGVFGRAPLRVRERVRRAARRRAARRDAQRRWCDGAAALLGADMAVLTAADPLPAAISYALLTAAELGIGVEVTPGVGSHRPAIRDRRMVVGRSTPTSSVPAWTELARQCRAPINGRGCLRPSGSGHCQPDRRPGGWHAVHDQGPAPFRAIGARGHARCRGLPCPRRCRTELRRAIS